jgi:predicted RNase H-like HicB family nuclease
LSRGRRCLAEGQTYQGAVAKAEGIIAEWIEPAHELGRPG